MDNESMNKICAWFGDILNIAALLATFIVIVGLITTQSKLLILVGMGSLVFIVFIKYADVKRFKGTVQSYEDIPPLGLARGSVRSLLALSFVAGLGLYIYYATKIQKFEPEIFTALSSIISAIVGFYFGSKTAATAQTSKERATPEIIGIEPKVGKAGTDVPITNLIGSGFQLNSTVFLVLGADKIEAEDVNVVQPTKITCLFRLPANAKAGDWNVVVINPDGEKSTLSKGFKIDPP